MKPEEFGYEELRDTHERERGGNRLVDLPQGFYAAAQDYLDRVRRELEDSNRADPGSTEVRLLQDEYQSARESLVSIYDIRVRKILQMAHTASKGGSVATDDLAPEERDVYTELLAILEASRGGVLKGARKGERRLLIRVIEDLPPVTGTDLRVYLMRAEDLISLPEDTAQILVDRGKAVVVEMSGRR